MIKEVVVALLTNAINRYEDANTDRLFKSGVIRDLNLILDYVEDMKEEKEPITVVLSNKEEVAALKKRIRELEETCTANNEIIEKLKNKKYIWQACDLRKEIEERDDDLSIR